MRWVLFAAGSLLLVFHLISFVGAGVYFLHIWSGGGSDYVDIRGVERLETYSFCFLIGALDIAMLAFAFKYVWNPLSGRMPLVLATILQVFLSFLFLAYPAFLGQDAGTFFLDFLSSFQHLAIMGIVFSVCYLALSRWRVPNEAGPNRAA